MHPTLFFLFPTSLLLAVCAYPSGLDDRLDFSFGTRCRCSCTATRLATLFRAAACNCCTRGNSRRLRIELLCVYHGPRIWGVAAHRALEWHDDNQRAGVPKLHLWVTEPRIRIFALLVPEPPAWNRHIRCDGLRRVAVHLCATDTGRASQSGDLAGDATDAGLYMCESHRLRCMFIPAHV